MCICMPSLPYSILFLLLNYFYNSVFVSFFNVNSHLQYTQILFLITVFSFCQDELVLVACFDLSLRGGVLASSLL